MGVRFVGGESWQCPMDRTQLPRPSASCLLPPGLQTGLASPSQSLRHFLGPHPNCPQQQAGRILESGHTTRLQEFMLFLLLTDPPGAYVPDGVGGTPGRESGGLGFRPIWGPTALYNLDLRGVPVGQVRNYQWGSKGPARSKMHSFNRYFFELLLRARHWARPWGYSNEPGREISALVVLPA